MFEIYFLEMWKLGDILTDRSTFLKLHPQENDFLTPDGDRTRKLLMTDEKSLIRRLEVRSPSRAHKSFL